MYRSRITAVFALLLLLASSGIGQQISRPFTEAKGLPDQIEVSHFEFSRSNYKYTVSRYGRGKRESGDTAAHSFDLRLDKHDYLARVIYHAEYQDDLLLIYEVTDGESGAGFITRLDGRTLKTKWKRMIPAFSVGQGLIEAKFAYVTAIGFVGKVDLDSGVFIWRHNNLYREADGAFNSFELPKISGNTVVFTESENYLKKKAAVIRVQKRNGRIIGRDV